MNNRITLFLMSYKGYFVFQRILSEFDPLIIDKVISSEDNGVSEDFYLDIKELAESNNIQFFNKKDTFDIKTRYVFAISWRWMINHNGKLIILHDSLLPRYRGFSPLVSCLINKEKYIGVTAIYANKEYDTGNIIEQEGIEITYPIKIFEAIKIITPLYFEIIKKIISKIIEKKVITSYKQDELNASYSLWRDSNDYRINWDKDSNYIKRFTDALGFPFPGATSFIGNKKVRILEAEEYNEVTIENREPGKVIFLKNANPVVVCGTGLLLITKIIEDGTNNLILPLKNIRIRFT